MITSNTNHSFILLSPHTASCLVQKLMFICNRYRYNANTTHYSLPIYAGQYVKKMMIGELMWWAPTERSDILYVFTCSKKITFTLSLFLIYMHDTVLDQTLLLVLIYKTEETLNASREIADTRY